MAELADEERRALDAAACGNCGERAAVRAVVERILTAREAAAERRGAVNALREEAARAESLMTAFREGVASSGAPCSSWALGFQDAMTIDVSALRERADRIEAGDA